MQFHEFYIGQVFTTKAITLTEEDISRFATEYDPQYMHLDKAKAEQGRFQGIIASGIQTLAISFKLWIETGSYGEDIIAGTAMNHVKFIRPVYPGDELHAVVEVVELKKWRHKTGIVTVRMSTFNARQEKVFTGELSAMVKNEHTA